jgi:lactoylglutathione lyase
MESGAFPVSLAVKDINRSWKFYAALDFVRCGGDIWKNWLIIRNGGHTIGLFQGMFERNMATFNPGWGDDGEGLKSYTDVREIQRELVNLRLLVESVTDEAGSGPASFIVVDLDRIPVLLDQHV